MEDSSREESTSAELDPGASGDTSPESKRMKTSDSGLVRSEESSTSSTNTEQENASGQSISPDTGSPSLPSDNDSGFKGFSRSSRIKERNYRSQTEDDDDEEEHPDAQDVAMEEVDQTERQRQDQEHQPSEDLATETEEHRSSAEDEEGEETTAEPEEGEREEEDQQDEDVDLDDIDFFGYSFEGDGNFSSSSNSSGDNRLFVDSPSDGDSSSNSTVMHTDDGTDPKDHPLFHKEKPKHQWFVYDALKARQLGHSARLQSHELFTRKCYGSLYCVRRLELMYKLEEHAGCVNSLNFSPDGSLLASGADDLKCVLWDWKIGKSMLKFKTKHRGNVFQSKFLHLSGDLHIATCARDGQVRHHQVSKEEGLRSTKLLGSHKGPCHKLIVLPEQPQIILSAGEDGVVIRHDVRGTKSTKVTTVREDEREVALYSIHGDPLRTNEFCVSGRDSLVRIYDQRKSSKPRATFTPFAKNQNGKPNRNMHVTCAVYNHNGSEILASYSDADVYLFDANNATPGEFLHQYQGHRNAATIKGVNFFGPESEFVVSGSDCGHVYFWERKTEALVQWLLADDSGVVNCLEPHPQLPFICTSGLDWDVKVWVPSCEKEPNMEGLENTVKVNTKTKLNNVPDQSEINESQMLWMLWRHLRNNRVRNPENRDVQNAYQGSNSSNSGSASGHDDSEEELRRAPNCRQS